ncbi:MAG: caspase family protein [Bacteroidota bacterium]
MPAPKKAKGFSLHIGIDRVDNSFYSKRLTRLTSAENDARAMAKIASDNRYEKIEMLLSDQATREAVQQTIQDYIRDLQSGDMFFLTYSGHGARVPDLNKDEANGKDETFCLYDGLLIDDELSEWMSPLRDGVRILVIADCCYSGGIIEDLSKTFKSRTNQNKKNNTKQSTVQFIGFSSAQNYQLASSKGKHGTFTAHLIEIYERTKGEITYGTLFAQITRQMIPAQKPTYEYVHDKMEEDRVFRI